MPIRQKVFAIMAAFALFIFILELVRRKKLRIEYSYLWLLTGAGVLILSVRYDLLVWITQAIGAVWPTTTLFLFALLFLIIICVFFSVRLSSLSDQVQDLSQEIALLKSDQAPRAEPPP